MLSSNESTSLKKSYLEFSRGLNDNHITQFAKLADDFQRFEFINEFPLTLPQINAVKNNKNISEAKLLKEKGNDAFQSSNFKLALKLYTKSLLKSPLDQESNAVAIIRANRSAALYHLEEYEASLVDIEAALNLGYPKDTVYKVKDRKARCLLALKKNESGLAVIKETISALDDAKLPSERRMKWQKDLQIMISMMTKNKLYDVQTTHNKKTKIDGERNQVYVAMNDSIDIKYDELTGRYAEAKKDIELGEIFLCEAAHCSVLLEDQCEDHCYHCMKSICSGEPCPQCDKVKFCSEQCQKLALNTYHIIECPILQTLWESGISVTCLMALRIITQKNLQYFCQLENKLKEHTDNGLWDKKQYTSKDYLTVSQLVRHEEKRTIDALIHKTYVAIYLFRCLLETGYLRDISTKEQQKYQTFIGGLLLKNLQLLQFNTHEIFELQCPKSDLSKSKTKFIGGGLYPTLALFNHSCNPSMVRYFEGTKVFARAIRPIKSGEMVAENYGQIFTEMGIHERQKELKERYWFECKCEPCSKEWPLLKDMDSNSLRFRCDNKICTNVIVVPSTSVDFMVTCSECNKKTNILMGLKALQDSDDLYKIAQNFLKSGESEKALKKYMQLLLLLNENLAPPFRDYHLCQQGLRTCYLTNGNIVKQY